MKLQVVTGYIIIVGKGSLLLGIFFIFADFNRDFLAIKFNL